MQDALQVKTERDPSAGRLITRTFSDEDASLILDAWGEFVRSLTPDQRTLAHLWDSLQGEFIRGQRCSVCARAGRPECATEC